VSSLFLIFLSGFCLLFNTLACNSTVTDCTLSLSWAAVAAVCSTVFPYNHSDATFEG